MRLLLKNNYDALKEALDLLLGVIRDDNIWPQNKPNAEALKSTTPFAVDCMPFESWLVYIFVPKMRAIASADIPIPAMSIAPAAEMYLPSTATTVLAQIRELDRLVLDLNETTPREVH